MHFLIPAVALLSQSAAVFGAAVPKAVPAAISAPTAVENAPMQAIATRAVSPDEQLNLNILARAPTTIIKSFIPTAVEARAPPPTSEDLFQPPPPNPVWPPLPPIPVKPQEPQTFSPQCHLETQEECDRVR
ncbi:hypothetical protein QBC40DRAFT_251486 [Triangularia verruculosa]|uniref:Uncharacterized protein n=1 Tax=Triangularia verruculosa TaxID=2587418 RepID=A0AAN6XR27_9PEZI|nr:hypothetical protein QBC40DRAFT_251486 [Triangularia verruculosa]